VYEPFPPLGEAVHVAEPPAVIDDGETEHVAESAGLLTVTLLEQFTVTLEAPEVTVTVAVFEPAVPYVIVADEPEPESESVPLHEYVYEPFPPLGEAVHVAFWPVVIDVGEAEQDAERGVPGTVYGKS
jgi:hypothetical protein